MAAVIHSRMVRLSAVLCIILGLLNHEGSEAQVQGEMVNHMQGEVVNVDMGDISESIRKPNYNADDIYIVVRLPGKSEGKI